MWFDLFKNMKSKMSVKCLYPQTNNAPSTDILLANASPKAQSPIQPYK